MASLPPNQDKTNDFAGSYGSRHAGPHGLQSAGDHVSDELGLNRSTSQTQLVQGIQMSHGKNPPILSIEILVV